MSTGTIVHVQRIKALDALRGIAVLMVFAYHLVRLIQTSGVLSVPVKLVLATGMFGVDLFYVLSGFFITKAILSPATWSRSSYLRSRITRIYPAYLLCLLVCAGIAVFTEQVRLPDLATALLLHLTMLHNFVPGMPGKFNGVFWTLGVEFPYYFLMLAIGFGLRDRRYFWKISGIALVVAVLFRYCVYALTPSGAASESTRLFLSTQVIGSLDAFFVGGIVAYLSLQRMGVSARAALPNLLISACTCMILLYFISLHLSDFWTNPFTMVWWRALLSISYGLVIFFIINLNIDKLLSWSGLPFMGKISFSFYLWHLPVITYFAGKNQPDSTTLAVLLPKLALILISSVVLAWTSWRFIETRFHPT
jgi:peptidoglycan/LPS O-acetylase OafA/YrhL